MEKENTPYSQLIYNLINHWSCWEKHENYYLNILVPSLILKPENGDDTERKILFELRKILKDNEWNNLPIIISEHRAIQPQIIEFEKEILLQKVLKKKAELEDHRKKILREEQELKERAHQQQIKIQNEIKIKKEMTLTRISLEEKIFKLLHTNYLECEEFYINECQFYINRIDFEKIKVDFVKSWVTKETGREPDIEQAVAIAATHNNYQVVARAGSGKTTTIVNRAFFLLKHCRIAPSEILLLAFNRAAAFEIKKRLLCLIEKGADAAILAEVKRKKESLKKQNKKIRWNEIEFAAIDIVASTLKIELPPSMTFHALAHSIVNPKEKLLFNNEEIGSKDLSYIVQQIIDAYKKIPEFNNQIREVMLAHFRKDYEQIFLNCDDSVDEKFLSFRRSLPHESIRGEYVKSSGEKIIADFLFEHNIPYDYENNLFWNGIHYSPDFTIFLNSEDYEKKGIIIEFYEDKDYDDVDIAREYCNNKIGLTLIEIFHVDIAHNGRDNFEKMLKAKLENLGILCRRLSDNEIWVKIKDRLIYKFTDSMVGFIGRCRKLSLSQTDFYAFINHSPSIATVETMYLQLAAQLYSAYLDRIIATGEYDFDGLIQEAVKKISEGSTIFQRKEGNANCDLKLLKYIFIDEFQDFSGLFYKLLTSIRDKNANVELFCVGDDWQAINGFAGSDLKYFENFAYHIGSSFKLDISTNYRSERAIVDIGNALMAGLGKPATTYKRTLGEVLVSYVENFKPTFIEKQKHSNDNITPLVLRLINNALVNNMDVVILARCNSIPWRQINYTSRSNLQNYLDYIRTFFSEELKKRISISTSHKFKGLEKSMVIVIDAVNRSYPLIHPLWIFYRIFGDTPQKIIADEKRLFYVTLTRAVNKLVLITEDKKKSPFLLNIKHQLKLINWNDYPPPEDTNQNNQKIVVQVSSAKTFAIKHLFKAYNYNWNGIERVWEKIYMANGFKFEHLKNEEWSECALDVEVFILNETHVIKASYLKDSEGWHCRFDNLKDFQS